MIGHYLFFVTISHIQNFNPIQDASTENKLRLLMIYAIVYPEKFEGDKSTKLMQVTTAVPLVGYIMKQQ